MFNALHESYGKIRDENDLVRAIQALNNPVACALLAIREQHQFDDPSLPAVQQWTIINPTYGNRFPKPLLKRHLQEAGRLVRAAFSPSPMSSLSVYITKVFLNIFESSLMHLSDYDTLLVNWRQDANWLLTKDEFPVVEELLIPCWQRFAQTASWQKRQARAQELDTISLVLPEGLDPWQYLASLNSVPAITAVRWYGQHQEHVTAQRLAEATDNFDEQQATTTLNSLAEAGVMRFEDEQYMPTGQHILVLAFILGELFGLQEDGIRGHLKDIVGFKMPVVKSSKESL